MKTKPYTYGDWSGTDYETQTAIVRDCTFRGEERQLIQFTHGNMLIVCKISFEGSTPESVIEATRAAMLAA